MAGCDEILELISGDIDGALTAEERRRLEAHLAQCPACRSLRADFAAMHRLLPTLAAEPPADLKEHVMTAVHRQNTTPFHTRKSQWRRRSWASLAAVLALVLVGGGAVRLWAPAVERGAAPQAALFAGSGAPAYSAADAGGAEAQGRALPSPTTEEDAAEDGGPAVMSLLPEEAAESSDKRFSLQTEEEARQALLDWLGRPDAFLVSLGLSPDGTAYRFRSGEAESAVTYSVPLDGGVIVLEVP